MGEKLYLKRLPDFFEVNGRFPAGQTHSIRMNGEAYKIIGGGFDGTLSKDLIDLMFTNEPYPEELKQAKSLLDQEVNEKTTNDDLIAIAVLKKLGKLKDLTKLNKTKLLELIKGGE